MNVICRYRGRTFSIAPKSWPVEWNRGRFWLWAILSQIKPPLLFFALEDSLATFAGLSSVYDQSCDEIKWMSITFDWLWEDGQGVRICIVSLPLSVALHTWHIISTSSNDRIQIQLYRQHLSPILKRSNGVDSPRLYLFWYIRSDGVKNLGRCLSPSSSSFGRSSAMWCALCASA